MSEGKSSRGFAGFGGMSLEDDDVMIWACSAYLVFCAVNPSVDSQHKSQVMKIFDVFFIISLDIILNKNSRMACEMLRPKPLCDVTVVRFLERRYVMMYVSLSTYIKI